MFIIIELKYLILGFISIILLKKLFTNILLQKSSNSKLLYKSSISKLLGKFSLPNCFNLARIFDSYVKKIYSFSLFLSDDYNKKVIFLILKLYNLSLISLNLKTPNFILNVSSFVSYLSHQSILFSFHSFHLPLLKR